MSRVSDRVVEKLGAENFQLTEKGLLGNCPACDEDEAGKGYNKLLITTSGSIVCHRYNGMDADTRRQHVLVICNLLDINVGFEGYTTRAEDLTFRLGKKEVEGKYTIEVIRSGRLIHIEQINPLLAADRRKLLTYLGFQAGSEQDQALLDLAGRFLRGQNEKPQVVKEAPASMRLSDGRLVEHTLSGLAVYDPALQTSEIKRSVEDLGVKYVPWTSGVSLDGGPGVMLPKTVVEYHSEAKLHERIVEYLNRLGLAFEKEPVKDYIIQTYFFDSFLEFPALRFRGPDSYKLARLVGLACYKPIFLKAGPSSLAFCLMLEKFRPTLVASTQMFWDQGYTQDSVCLMYKGEPRMFSTYGPRILPEWVAYSQTDVTVKTSHTSVQQEVPPVSTPEILSEAESLRGVLTLYRMRNRKGQSAAPYITIPPIDDEIPF